MATHLQPSSPPNKRPRTLSPNSQSPPSKGKSKVEEELSPPTADDEPADCCGICLSEAGVSRGQIECCDHYYCFVCIMEWAKVESKCPFCKRRFSTIRRPPKPPLFPCERVVRVPIRDQVCYYSGNATIGPPELYSEVKCGICQGITDESLLLLCDLCDSAAHTYCVGLGYTVPEGDWFCQDCTLLKDEHLKSEPNSEPDVQMSFPSIDRISRNEHISILDIVQDSHGHVVRSSGSASSDPCYSSLSASTIGVVMRNNSKRSSSTSLDPIPNARTLRHCRNLHDRIRVLRQNWNGFRSGTFRFSSNQGEANISQKPGTRRIKEYTVPCLNKQSIAQCSSSDVKNDTKNHEIQKAWEMFDKAKSVRQDRERPNISKFPIRKLNPVRSSVHASNRQQVSLDSQQNGAKTVGNMGAAGHYCSSEKDCYERPSASSKEKDCYGKPCSSSKEKGCYDQPSSSTGKGMWKLHEAKDVTYCQGSIAGHSPAHQEFRSSKEIPMLSHIANARNVQPPAKETLKRPHCLGSDASGTTVPNNDMMKGVNHMSSSNNKVKCSKEKREIKKIYVDIQQYNDAKSEIQSLVKLNLKLQTKDEKLEVDTFKEVARLATHSILGACGLEEQREPRLSSIPGIKCSHTDHIRQDGKSSLMPSSCRECFYAFVKDVVNSSILQKKSCQKNA